MLTGTNLTVQGDNSSATTEPGEYIGPSWLVLKASVWYSWTAPTAGVVYFSGGATNPDFRFTLGIYRGNALDSLTVPAAAQDGGFFVVPGDTFQLQIASAQDPFWLNGGGTGPFTLAVRLVVRTPASENDAFANRFDINSPIYRFEGSIYNATSEPDEPLPAFNHRQTLWWRFVPPEDGGLHIALTGPFAAKVAAYEGASFVEMIPLPGVNGARYRVQRGREYSIQVASVVVPSGNFSMDAIFRSAANDMFAGSERLEGTNKTYFGNFTFATREPNEPPSPASNTVWASWAAPFSGVARFAGPRSSLPQYVNVFTGPALGRLEPVPVVDVSYPTMGFQATEGIIYHFQFCGNLDDFAFPFEIVPHQPPSNDHFSAAQAVSGSGSVIAFAPKSVVGATMELGEPAHMVAAAQKSIWWKWEAPRSGYLDLRATSLFIPKVTLAVYQGNAVNALGLVAKGTNQVQFVAHGGETYYFAGAVPAAARGEINCSAQQFGLVPGSLLLPGNLLCEPSWEGTGILDARCWRTSGGIGGFVNEPGGCHGSTWPVLGSGDRIWQDIPTVPGHKYAIQFAHQLYHQQDCACGVASVRVLWDARDLGIASIPEYENGWHWEVFTANASNTTSRVTFENLHRHLEMDAFSVVDLQAAPTILTRPSSISTVAGGSAAFIVRANGSAPLGYQWHFNQQPLPGKTGPMLVLDPVTAANAGSYFATVNNAFGSTTSPPAVLVVEMATNATILVQPYGDTVPVGGYFHLSAVAAGTPPLSYQWFLNAQAVADATNRYLTLTNVQPTHAGQYEVRVQNRASSVWSLPARLTVATNLTGGGTIDFRNRFLSSAGTTHEALVFNMDGLTRLNGSEYVAQLYAGPSLETIRPAGSATPFSTGFSAGLFVPQLVTLANVAPGARAFVQVRAWEQARGTSYEEARALGGRFGRSAVLAVTAGNDGLVPGKLVGLASFSLQAGLPSFNVGAIELVEQNPDGTILWSLRGQPGFRYLVEKSVDSPDLIWRPYQMLTNVTGTVTFSDSTDNGLGTVLYRSRILD